MIDCVVGVFAAEPQAMRAAQPTQVASRHILVIAEKEWVRDVRIAYGRKAADREARIAALQSVRPVRARNAQRFQPVVFINVNVLRAQPLPREADVAVEQQAWRQRVGSADASALHAARRVARLSARERIAEGRAERRRIENL